MRRGRALLLGAVSVLLGALGAFACWAVAWTLGDRGELTFEMAGPVTVAGVQPAPDAPAAGRGGLGDLRQFLSRNSLALVNASGGDGTPVAVVFDPGGLVPWFPRLAGTDYGSGRTWVYVVAGSYAAEAWGRTGSLPYAVGGVPAADFVRGAVAVPRDAAGLQVVRPLQDVPLQPGRVVVSTTSPDLVADLADLLGRHGLELEAPRAVPVAQYLAQNPLVGLAVALRAGARLRAEGAVAFAAFYDPRGVSGADPALVSLLRKGLEDGRAYALVLNNAGVADPGFGARPSPVVLLGGAASRVFPDLAACGPAPCALAGPGVDASTRAHGVQIAGTRVAVGGSLPAGAAVFDPDAGPAPLDDRVLVRLPPGWLPRLHPVEREEAVTRTVLLAPAAADVDAVVALASRRGLNLVPEDVADIQPQRFADLMTRSALYVGAMAAFLLLAGAALAATTTQTLRRERDQFTIRSVYGAGPVHVATRVGAYLALQTIALPAVALLPAWAAGGPLATGALWALGAVLALYAAGVAAGVRQALRLRLGE